MPSSPKSPDFVLARLQAKAAMTADAQTAEKPQQLWLPGLDLGAMPNHLNRSSFFAPVARGRRKFHRQTAMVSRADCVLEYTGEQLDEADADLVMALIHFARPHPLGTAVPLNRAALLREIGRNIGKAQYEWLHRRMRALAEGSLYIEARRPDGAVRYRIGRAVAFHIVSFELDADGDTYSFRMDPRWVQMFGNREFSLIDWQKRMQIGRGQDMAKTLQRLVATSADSPQRYGLLWLKAKMDYEGRQRDFRTALLKATGELQRLDVIAKAKIEVSTKGHPQLVLWLPPASV
jgi:hypothetical protein